MLEKFLEQFKSNLVRDDRYMSSPLVNSSNLTEKYSLKKLSKHALDLYVKKSDISNFTKLALSDPEDKSHNTIVNQLKQESDFVDPFEELHIDELVGNENFLRDLGL